MDFPLIIIRLPSGIEMFSNRKDFLKALIDRSEVITIRHDIALNFDWKTYFYLFVLSL